MYVNYNMQLVFKCQVDTCNYCVSLTHVYKMLVQLMYSQTCIKQSSMGITKTDSLQADDCLIQWNLNWVNGNLHVWLLKAGDCLRGDPQHSFTVYKSRMRQIWYIFKKSINTCIDTCKK